MYIVLKNDGLDCIVDNIEEFLYLRFDFYIENRQFYIRPKDASLYVNKNYRNLRSYTDEFTNQEIIRDVIKNELLRFCKSYNYKIFKSEPIN